MADYNYQIHNIFTIILFSFSISLRSSLSQPLPAPSPESNACNGVFLSYNYTTGYPIPPENSTNQAYRFESSVTILNNGRDEVSSWSLFVGFRYNEILVSVSNAVLADGSSLPANVGNGTVLVGFPVSDLKSAVETAGNLNLMEVRVGLVGTQFGVGAPDVPLPGIIALTNDGYSCPAPTKKGETEIHVCCVKDSNFKPILNTEDEFTPRQNGDLIIMYDVISSYDDNYWAQVSIANHDPLGRLDGWKLSFEWTRHEFIYTTKGAYPYVVDASGCVFGTQGQHYKDMDFSKVLSCERNPTIIDLPSTMANDSAFGRIPFCCRNGTILPNTMDQTKSTSVFQMQVYKMPPDLNKTDLVPPRNWRINGSELGSEYRCRSPIRVTSSKFPSTTIGLPSESTAIASWQVVCDVIRVDDSSSRPGCCVSFSAFWNDSVVPCNTCACGCVNENDNYPTETCSETTPPLLLRPDTLLVPFPNRTRDALEWSKLKDRKVPNPLPCGDNCGVSINWHLHSDYKRGWTARITVFNWGRTDFVDWFAAVEMDKAGPGFETAYSFNASMLNGSSNTIFMKGLSGSNYLSAETNGNNPKKDPRVPGTQQSVILFTKKTMPEIDVAKGDGYPTRVFFNGEECSLPSIFPSGSSRKTSVAVFSLVIVQVFLLYLMRR